MESQSYYSVQQLHFRRQHKRQYSLVQFSVAKLRFRILLRRPDHLSHEAMAVSVEVSNALAVVAVSVIAFQVLRFMRSALWEPLRLRRIMAKQGVKGPPYRFLFGQVIEQVAFQDSFPEALPLGNYATFSPTVTPQYALYFPRYGKTFLYWRGTDTRFCVRDAELAKEVFIHHHASLKRSDVEDKIISQVVGTGLLIHQGEKWLTERRQLNPFFHQDALKGMVKAMVEGTTPELQKWEQMAAGGTTEIDVEPGLHRMSGRMLSLTALGLDFDKGEQIRELQTEIASDVFETIRNPAYWLIPGYRKLPTKRNRHIDQCVAKVHALLHEAIHGRREAVRRREAASYGADLLGSMLSAATEGWGESAPEFNLASVFSNAQLMYFGGQTTVANTSLFAMLLLAVHPEWQERARQEVAEILGGASVDASALPRLKVVGMVIHETLRLFSPAPSIARETTQDVRLKTGLFIPKGITVEFAMAAIHQDRDYWGNDVAEFNPGRFANGVSGACTHPQAFAPFGLGPKFCLGNNFAVMEVKVVVASVLQRFELRVSPKYRHHPTFTLLQKPKFGLPLILKPLATNMHEKRVNDRLSPS